MNDNQTSSFELTESQKVISSTISWTFECVLTLMVAPLGVIFNILALYTLTSTKLFHSFFNKLLAFMAVYDILYLLVSISEAIRQFLFKSCLHDYIFVIIVYPVRSMLMCCSTYTTLELAFERYNNVCKPIANFQKYGNRRQKSEWKRLAINIVPVLIFSILFYLPKFLELETIECELQCPYIYSNNNKNCSRKRIITTDLRRNSYYVTWYINVANDLCTWVIPFVTLFYLNICIYYRLKQYLHAKFSRLKLKPAQGSRKEESNQGNVHQAIVLFLIVTLFFICHANRAILNIAELIDLIEKRFFPEENSNNTHQFWARILYPISHFLLKLNASVNFFIYLACDKMFRQAIMEKIFTHRSHSGENSSEQQSQKPLPDVKRCRLNQTPKMHSIETKKTMIETMPT